MAAGRSKEREGVELGRKERSLEEERRGEREEKKNLKAKREEERGENERRILAEERREVRNFAGFWKRSNGFRSMSRTTLWVWL